MQCEARISERADRHCGCHPPHRLRTGNAVSVQLRDELDRVMDDLDHDDEGRVLLIRANGALVGTGYHLKGFSRHWNADSAMNAVQRRPHRCNFVRWRRDFHLLRERQMDSFRPRPCTIAVVQGHCVAGSMTGQVLHVAGGACG